MANIIHDCPFCKGKGAAFRLAADTRHPKGLFHWYSMGICGVCSNTALFVVTTITDSGPSQINSTGIESIGTCYPTPPQPRIPASIPENVSLPLLEAEGSFTDGRYSAAGSCYRKAIERAIRHIDPQISGMLNKRIRKLEERKLIPHSMIDLLDQVRLFGNTSMHEDEEDPTEEDCAAARDFADLFLTYAFSLPEKVRAAKEKLTH